MYRSLSVSDETRANARLGVLIRLALAAVLDHAQSGDRLDQLWLRRGLALLWLNPIRLGVRRNQETGGATIDCCELGVEGLRA
jgi:hypothetical protein